MCKQKKCAGQQSYSENLGTKFDVHITSYRSLAALIKTIKNPKTQTGVKADLESESGRSSVTELAARLHLHVPKDSGQAS